MTDQTSDDTLGQAFGHLLERSLALSGDRPADRILLRDYLTEVEIGAFQQERGHRQRLRFNVVVEVAPAQEDLEDDVDRILSYDSLTEAIAAELAAERLNLLETLADRVAARILAAPLASRVFLRIEKLDRGPFALGVEIMRSRALGHAEPGETGTSSAGGEGTRGMAAEAPDPLVVFLSRRAARAPHLHAWLDRLERLPRPVILCCGPADDGRPHAGGTAGAPLPQRRIDLLAIEQAAWVLAARDARCVVVNTRTELDWAMKHHRISLWAPSKIVLDAVGDRPDVVGDGLALALWFAGLMQASDLLVLGETLPVGASGLRLTRSDPGLATLTLPEPLAHMNSEDLA